ncbi:hypothetical protein EVAR_28564_1 [Eumeta japonica]|uniref:Uncharacterized protein n=1 Tax=Eumeta variegata TaxID=151549 RepID=A0A4C1UWP7_EUMVA|nr:hypothetical protein EVAR_28564_1 [Eumeta japonica]
MPWWGGPIIGLESGRRYGTAANRCSGVVHPTVNQPSHCKARLNKSLKENAVHHLIAATPQNALTTEACAREERQSGVRAYAAIAEIAVTMF